MANASIGNVELTISNGGWNGDFVLDASGDLALSIDTVSAQTATQERLLRLVMTTPMIADGHGNPQMPPDDIFNPKYGVGADWYVDDDPDEMQPKITAAIFSQLTTDPSIAQIPAPSVSFSSDPKSGNVYIVVSVSLKNGQRVSIGPVDIRQGV